MSKKINLPFYNLKTFDDIGGACVIAGPSYSGKSTFALDLLASKVDILNYAVCFSYTEKYSPAFGRHIHPNLIHPRLEESTFNQILSFHKLQFQKDPSLRIAIVLDDCMSATAFLKWQSVKELFYQARHIGVFFIVITQHLMLIPNNFRNSCAILVFCKNPSAATRKSYHSQFFSQLGNFNQFDKVFQFYTSEHRVIVLKCRNVSYDPLESISYYKSNSYQNGTYSREFRIGNPSLWGYLDSKINNNILSSPFPTFV